MDSAPGVCFSHLMWAQSQGNFLSRSGRFFSAPLQVEAAVKSRNDIDPKPKNISEQNKAWTEALLNLEEELSRGKGKAEHLKQQF